MFYFMAETGLVFRVVSGYGFSIHKFTRPMQSWRGNKKMLCLFHQLQPLSLTKPTDTEKSGDVSAFFHSLHSHMKFRHQGQAPFSTVTRPEFIRPLAQFFSLTYWSGKCFFMGVNGINRADS